MEEWGSSVGSGWHPILRAGVYNLFLNGWSGETHQVKEKFGTLRFYASGEQSWMHGAFDAMEFASQFLCERCGSRGRLRSAKDGFNWMLTLCNMCAEWHLRRRDGLS